MQLFTDVLQKSVLKTSAKFTGKQLCRSLSAVANP